MSIRELQELVFEEYQKNGFLDQFFWAEPHEIADIAELGLVVTEVAEAMEAIRKGDAENVAEECADIIIRVLNFMSRAGLDAEEEIVKKNTRNRKRERLHGKKV